MRPGSRSASGVQPSRRGLLHLTAASAAALVAGCKPEDVLDEVSNWKIPDLNELELGEVQFGWDGDGNLYEIRPFEHSVTRVGRDGSEEWVIGGEDAVADGGLNAPIALGAGTVGTVAVVEAGGGRVSFYSPQGELLRQVGAPGAGEGQLLGATDAVADADGTLYVLDRLLHRIVVYDADGVYLRTLAERGARFGQLNAPRALARDRAGRLHVVDRGNRRIQVFDSDGNFVRAYGEPGSGDGALRSPWAISLDPLGNAWVSDPVGGAVHVYGPNGTHLRRLANLTLDGVEIQPLRVAITPDGGVYLHVNLARAGA